MELSICTYSLLMAGSAMQAVLKQCQLSIEITVLASLDARKRPLLALSLHQPIEVDLSRREWVTYRVDQLLIVESYQ